MKANVISELVRQPQPAEYQQVVLLKLSKEEASVLRTAAYACAARAERKADDLQKQVDTMYRLYDTLVEAEVPSESCHWQLAIQDN